MKGVAGAQQRHHHLAAKLDVKPMGRLVHRVEHLYMGGAGCMHLVGGSKATLLRELAYVHSDACTW